MPRMKDRSGQECKAYIFKDVLVRAVPYFLYEVCMYKYCSSGFCMLGSRLFRTDKLLNIKKASKLHHYKGYSIEKEISLIGVPYKFIRENNLPEYKSIRNKKLKKNGQVC